MAAGYCLTSRKRSDQDQVTLYAIAVRDLFVRRRSLCAGKGQEVELVPAPKEPFYMLMRMYLPKIEVLNGQNEIPGVVQAK